MLYLSIPMIYIPHTIVPNLFDWYRFHMYVNANFFVTYVLYTLP